MDMKRFFLYAIAIAALALAGCGGGGTGPTIDPDPEMGMGCPGDPGCPDPTGPTDAQRVAAMLIAPAIVNPDGDTKEDSEDPNFPEMGDLDGLGDAGVDDGDGNTVSSRPTHGVVAVDPSDQTVTVTPTDIPDVDMTDGGTPVSLGDVWNGSVHERIINNKKETAVVYTDVGGPDPQAWIEYYTSNADRDGVSAQPANGTTGEVSLAIDDLEELLPVFMLDGLPTIANSFTPYATDDRETSDENEGNHPGMFNGIPGMYNCGTSGGCRVETDADGDIASITGMWTFTPTVAEDGNIEDVMVQGVVDDTDYMWFGYWVEETTGDDGSVGINPFFGGNTLFGGQSPTAVVAALEGTAEYNGKATGMFVTKDDMGLANSGQFTADADLTANFGNMDDITDETAFTIDGLVSKFVLMDGETMVENSWMLMLNSARFSDPMRGTPDGGTGMAPITAHTTHTNTFSGATDGGGGDGEWTGMFFGSSEEAAMPSGVAGKFLGHFSGDLPGHAIGAFGAGIETEEAMP